MVKSCDLGLENAAFDLRPRAAFSRPRSQLFTIRTSQPANNLYLFRYRSNFSLLNSCTQLTKCLFCHANAMFDSEFYRRKIIKKLRTLLRKLIEIRQALNIIFITKFIGTNWLFGKIRFGHFSQVTWCPRSPSVLCLFFSYFVFLK